MTTLRALIAAGLVVGVFGAAVAKLPPPPPMTDAQKAAAEEKKAKDAAAAEKAKADQAAAEDRAMRSLELEVRTGRDRGFTDLTPACARFAAEASDEEGRLRIAIGQLPADQP